MNKMIRVSFLDVAFATEVFDESRANWMDRRGAEYFMDDYGTAIKRDW